MTLTLTLPFTFTCTLLTRSGVRQLESLAPGNNAAAALMYPIAAGASEQQGIDKDQMSMLLMLAASASFMSPFGYQTNLMVYGPGGYVFADFLRFGAPMQLVQMVVSVSVVLLGKLWWVGWLAGFGAIGGIYLARSVKSSLVTGKMAGEGTGKGKGNGAKAGAGAGTMAGEEEAKGAPSSLSKGVVARGGLEGRCDGGLSGVV